MNHVPKRWLNWLHIGYLLIDILILSSFLYLHFAKLNPAMTEFWGLTPVIAGLASIHFIYGTIIYPWFQKKNLWLAMVMSQALFDFLIVALIETSAEINNFYWIILTLTIGVSASLGVFAIVAEVITDATLYLLTILGLQTSGKSSLKIEFFWLCLAGASALIGWFIFRQYYDHELDENDQVTALNKLLTQVQLRSDLIIQSIADGVIVFDTSGQISLINQAASQITEWPATEAMGIDIRLVLKLATEEGKSIDKSEDLFTTSLKNKEHVNKILKITGRSGKTLTASIVISPIIVSPGDEVVGAVAVFRDVTTQRQEEQNRAEFISTASHEMRTPLAAIEGYLALALNDKVSSIDSKARDYLEKAHESTKHLGQLFQDLLTSAKAEDGRLSNHPVVVEMGEYLEKLTQDLQFSAQRKGLSMEFVIGSNQLIDTTTHVEGGTHVIRPLYYSRVDPDRVREVVTNLFDNAVKYTDTGKISVGLTGDDTVVQLYVRDTGPGIPASDIPHLFQKFYRVDSSITRTIGGTGLGLFICRKIIELYRGHIWVESELGKGSAFFINLPRLTTQKASELQAKEAANTALPTISSLNSSP